MMRPLLLASIASCLLFGGCSRARIIEKIVPAVDDAFAREHIDLLREKRFDQLERELDPSISDPSVQDTLHRMAEMFPAEEPKSIKVVDIRFSLSHGTSTHFLTVEYEFTDRWLLVRIAIKRVNEHPTITAFNVTPISESLESTNRFNLAGKGGSQYFVLSLALAALAFNIHAFVICVRTKMLKFKWLWAIFVFFGVGEFAVNWTTGQLAFTPLAVHLPCASVSAVPAYGPWTVAVSLPLGAFMFIARPSKSEARGEDHSHPAEQLPPTPPADA